jgi:NTE family protein
MTEQRIGLVLSGGGAKGAYQVGVLKALLGAGTRIDAVAGASIGALNAGILASAPSLQVGVARMEELWLALANCSPLQHNLPAYFRLLLASGMTLTMGEFFSQAKTVWRGIGLPLPDFLDVGDDGFLSSTPLNDMMNRYFDAETISTGIPLYVSVYKSGGGLRDLAAVAAAELGLCDTAPSEFLHIQSLPKAQQKEALLASAAMPLLFKPGQMRGAQFADGGMGGWQTSQGNTPVGALLQAGINTVIVTHLSDGSLWSRHDFPDANVFEIRPKQSLKRDGGMRDVLGFDPIKIPSWIEQGYSDTQACLGRLTEVVSARAMLRDSEASLTRAHARQGALDGGLVAAMARLRLQQS